MFIICIHFAQDQYQVLLSAPPPFHFNKKENSLSCSVLIRLKMYKLMKMAPCYLTGLDQCKIEEALGIIRL